jgi:predicted NBD/HSP70 family sugar kinase
MLENGPLCNCGNRGCLETICGIPALLRRAGEQLSVCDPDDPLREIWHEKGRLTLEELLLSAEKEGSWAWKLMQETGHYVGLAIADAINLYNPQTIFVGGPLSSAAPIFQQILEDTARSHAFPDMAGVTQIRVSALGGRAGVIGACALALRDVLKSFQSPLFDENS